MTQNMSWSNRCTAPAIGHDKVILSINEEYMQRKLNVGFQYIVRAPTFSKVLRQYVPLRVLRQRYERQRQGVISRFDSTQSSMTIESS